MNKIYPLIISLLIIGFYSCQNASKDSAHNTTEDAKETPASSTVVKVGEISDFVGKYDVTKDPQTENEILKGLNFGISDMQYKKIEKNTCHNLRMMRSTDIILATLVFII